MGIIRLEVPLAPARLQDDQAAERTLREVSARFVPGLESTVGAIDSREGDRVRVIWSAEGWLPDMTFVSLSADVGSSAILLHMDTCYPLQPPAPPWTRAYTAAFWISLAAGGGGAAWRFQAFWPTVGAVVAVLLMWIVPDIALQSRKDRIAQARVLDEAAWRERLIAAVG
jgi:hypothetical protein